jgi:DNA polymerase elongation subunit (family B)
MLRHNISPETVLCSCCTDSPNQVPQLGYHICYKKQGIIPEVLKPILFRRFCFKARSRNKNYSREIYEELQNAWKWILLVCFGYTGYRNARYGRIECHESITAFSRDILLTALEIAEREGYEVLHGIIDSLWVKNKEHRIVPWRLARLISKKTKIRLEVKGRYRWIIFLPSKDTGMGALNRYYGIFDTGEVKIRGIELRQHNTPTFIRNVQKDMIEALSRANDAKDFYDLIPDCIRIMCDHGKHLLNGDVSSDDLVITSRVSKNVSSYKVNTLVRAALLQLKDQGVLLEPGQSVRYVVKDERESHYKHRICIAENLCNDEKVDFSFYLRKIARCGESILIPFGYRAEFLEKMLYELKLVKN